MFNLQFSKNVQFTIFNVLNFLLKTFLFLLPWQTIYIYRPAFMSGVKWEYGTLGFYGTEILLWVIVVLFMVWYWRQFKLKTKNLKLKITKDRVFVFSLLLFIIYHLSSIIWSADKSLALQQSIRVMEAVLLFLVIYIGPFEKQKLAKWFVVGSIIPALLGIGQFLLQMTFANKWLGIAAHELSAAGTSIVASDNVGRWLRAYGSFSHPNVFGGYLTFSILFILLLSYKKFNFFLITSYCLLVTAIFYSFSRSAWLALFVAIGYFIFYFYWRGEKKLAFYLFSLSLLLLIVFTSLFSFLIKVRLPDVKVLPTSNWEITSARERVQGYHEAWALFKLHPVLGVGAGNYTYGLYELNPNRLGWEYQPVHNVLVLFVAEEGIVGLILFVFVIISFIIYHLSDTRYQITNNRLSFYLLSAICYLIIAFSDHYLYSSYVGLMLTAIFFVIILRKSEIDTNLV